MTKFKKGKSAYVEKCIQKYIVIECKMSTVHGTMYIAMWTQGFIDLTDTVCLLSSLILSTHMT